MRTSECEFECKIIEKERHGARINIISSDSRLIRVQRVDNKRHFTVHIFYKLYVQTIATCAYWSRTFRTRISHLCSPT